MGNFTPAQSFASHPLALMADPDARAKPGPADQRSAAGLQWLLQSDPPAQIGGWGGDRYEQLRHYRGIVAIAIRAYLDAIGGCKFNLLKKKTKAVQKSAGGQGHYSRDDEYEPVEPGAHPLADVLERPGGESGVWSMHEECAYLTLQHLLTGDAPAWMPVGHRHGRPVRFFALVGAMVSAQPGTSQDYPKGSYLVSSYNPGGFFAAGNLGTQARLPGEEVGRFRGLHPWSRNLGMSRLQVGDREIDCLEAITESRWAMFEHGPQFDTALLLPGMDVSECERLQKSVEKKYGGAKNARRFAVFGGGGLTDKIDLKTISQSSREMDFNQSYDQAAGVVASLFGVPKEIINFGIDSNYAKDWAAQQRFHDLAISPYCRMLGVFLTQHLARPWEKSYGELKIEVEPACPKNLETEAQTNNTGLQAGAKLVNEWRLANGLKPLPDGDVPLQIFLAKQQQAIAPQPVPGMPGAAPPGQQPGAAPSQDAPGADEQAAEPVEDTPEAARASVASAALGALGVPDTGGEDEQEQPEDVQKALHKFASTHVTLPPEIGQRLLSLAGMIPNRDLGEDGRENEPHVTVRYGLEVDDPSEVADVVRGFGPVRLRLGKVSIFAGDESGKAYDVLKVEVDSLDLHELNARLKQLPHTDTHPTYKPHATIAYVKAGLGEKYAEKMGSIDADCVSNAVVFSDRDRTQTRIPLDGIAKAITVTKPTGKRTRAEGETWQVGAQWYRKQAGKSVKIADPSKQRGAGKPPQPTGRVAPWGRGTSGDPNSVAEHDELAKRLLGARKSVTLPVPADRGVPAHVHIITGGDTLRRFLEKGGRLPDEHYLGAAKAVQIPGPATHAHLSAAHTWAAQHAQKHAAKVAAHFGISSERAHALLTHAMLQIAKHAAKNGGKVGALTIRDRTGKTARLSPTKAPASGPTNPDGAGTRAPRPTVGKAMGANMMSGPDGGFLVEPTLRARRKKKKLRACVARVMKGLPQEG
jgi:2'-5' RNA ligase